jgi:DNA-binding NarL/FixJ family response regulator
MNGIKYIAIADDHTMFRKTLAILINFFPDYKVLFDASNGKDFIGRLDHKQLPHIALLDINMPVMDGYDTAAWLRNNHSHIKILVLSTMEDETSIIKMIRKGANGYLLKDADPAELKYSFDKVLSNEYFYNHPDKELLNTGLNDNLSETIFQLTQPETEYLKYTTTEMRSKEIAGKMNISMCSAEIIRDSLYQKLGLKTRIGMALFAIENNLV